MALSSLFKRNNKRNHKRSLPKRAGVELEPVILELDNLDQEQLKAVTSNDDKILVIAGAGSGKTRVLTNRIKYLLSIGVEPSSIVAITFTNMAAEEMKLRLIGVPNIGDVFVGTIHSFANKVMKLTDEKYKIYDSDTEVSFFKELIEKYCRHLTFDRYIKYADLQQAFELGLVEEYQVSGFLSPSEQAEYSFLSGNNKSPNIEDINKNDYPETLSTLRTKYGVITFNELLVKATDYFTNKGIEMSNLLVDEFQDIGSLEYKFFESLNVTNRFYVGDDWQCQPSGTKVTLEDGSLINIEDLKVGDRVLSYNLKSGNYHKISRKGTGKEILDISVHTSPKLITIVTENKKESSYTPNHRCLARIHYQGNEDKSVVYIMKNSRGQYRVGSTKLFTDRDRNFGVRSRMNTEGATEAWILDVFDNPQKAWLAEQICSYKFGIPQVTWTLKNIKSTKTEIDSLYSHLDNLEVNVKRCLYMYGRDIKYPIFTKNINKHFSKIHVTEVRACNLIPRIMDVATPYLNEENIYKNNYEQITKVFINDNEEHKVYGLKVKDTETYVADNILTHNSIYGFKGGQVNIMLNLYSIGEYSVYPITTNYRNSKEVLSLASEVIEQVTTKIPKDIKCDSKEEGDVIILSKGDLKEMLTCIQEEYSSEYKDWFILVRTNKQLHEVENALIEVGLPYNSFSREGLSLATLNRVMKHNSVKLLTVHSSKGLENKNVILYGNFPVKQPSYLRNEEERKVMYVGVTRAIENLIVLN